MEQPPTPATPARVAMTGAWSPAEDERLTAAVLTHGTRWTTVAADVGTRNGEQCAKRWNDHVNPALEHGPWSVDEDKSLLDLVAVHGHNWKLMADASLKSRSPLSIKNRYALLARRQRRHKKRQIAPDATWQRDTIDGDTQNTHALPGSSLHMSPGSYWGDGTLPSSLPPYNTANASTLFAAQGNIDPIQQPSQVYSRQHDEGTNQFMSCLDWLGLDVTATMPDDSTDSSDDMTLATGGGRHNQAQVSLGSEGVGSPGSPEAGVEFSVTCTRAKLKAMVCHAFEGAMLEAAELPDESQMTVTLRLKR